MNAHQMLSFNFTVQKLRLILQQQLRSSNNLEREEHLTKYPDKLQVATGAQPNIQTECTSLEKYTTKMASQAEAANMSHF